MVRNPLRARAQRKTSAMLTRVGWEAPQTWPVPRPDGAPLVFQTRLPAAVFVPASELPRRRRAAPASVGGDILPLEQAGGEEHVFLAAAICSTEADHGVLATMTAALAEKPLPFSGRDGTTTGRRGRRKVKGMPARVTVVERQEGDAPGGAGSARSSSSTRSVTATARSRSPSWPTARGWPATPAGCFRTSSGAATWAPSRSSA